MIKILIADDEHMEREFLEKIISSRFGRNAEIRTAENGRIAVTIATLWNADVVLMDIEMPGMNGLDAASEILKQKPSAKIIFITAYSLFSYAHEALKLGASDYILKPVEADDVEKAIRKASGQVEAYRSLAEVAEEARKLGENDGLDKSGQLISRVMRYLQHNYMMYDISLDSVGGILGINPSYLSVLFKKSTGINFVDYISDLRINAAKELLKDPLKPNSEIARSVGYESSSYFARAFKKKTGMTPTDFRKMSALEVRT